MTAKLRTSEQREDAKKLSGTVFGAILGAGFGFLCAGVLGQGAAAEYSWLGLALGAIGGAVVGRVFMTSSVHESMEPGLSGRGYVGAYAPDPEENEGRGAARPRNQPPKF
jgi:hypothetical protein